MSTRSGNPKKQGQKHQNAFAFKHNKNSKLTIKIKKSPLDNLCKRCFDILEWKITYRKYKPLTAAAKCNTCLQKTIYKAYRTICDICAVPNMLCTKCGEKVTEYIKQKKSKKKDEIMDLVEALPERYKKTAIRKIDEGQSLTFDPIKGIVNEKGDIIIDISVCKDKIQDLIKVEDDNQESEEETKTTEEKKSEKKEKDILKVEEDKEELDNEESEEFDEDDGSDEEFEEELIDTFKEKNKISK